MSFIKKNIFFIAGLFFIFFFFHRFFLQGLLPIPADTIVGLYHPYRDFYIDEYPRGIPYENYLVTDPVRQQYLWKELAIDQIKDGNLPLWNPYNFSGYPLLANFQTGVFYPLNLLMIAMPFEYGWSLLIFSQLLLAYIFMYLYLRNLEISKGSSVFASIAFSFCGFFVSWLEWGNVVSTGLWLPLILYSTDKLLSSQKRPLFILKNWWLILYIFALCSSFFAGHLQTFFYISLVSVAYYLFRIYREKYFIRRISLLIFAFAAFLIITLVQSFPTLQLITLSARSVDQVAFNTSGWFIPWQNAIQFIAPDFFGNPATLNYWGEWNYGEFIGYIGIFPLALALAALLYVRKKEVFFFSVLGLTSILFTYPTFIAKIPFILELPFISSAQPTRLIFILDFALVVMSAYGFDLLIKRRKIIIVPLISIGAIIFLSWMYVYLNFKLPLEFQQSLEVINVSKSNLRLPTVIFVSTTIIVVAYSLIPKRLNPNYKYVILALAISIFLFDIFRFADKYTVFSKKDYLFPDTKSMTFLADRPDNFRIMELDQRVIPPNFSSHYKLESISGYDPLYLLRYGELAAAIGRNNADIHPPFGFNRIITPQNYSNEIINALGVKYLISLSEISSDNLRLAFEENETKIYENRSYIGKAFFAARTIGASSKQDAINLLFEHKDSLGAISIVEGDNFKNYNRNWSSGIAEIIDYKPNKVTIRVENDSEGFLVLSDSYYPTWRVNIDGVSSEIMRTNYNFRGVIVPAGSKEVVFSNHLF